MTRSSTFSVQSAPSKRSAFDALHHVTAEIGRFLEQGVMPWRAPWDQGRALALTPGLPLRSTGEPYRGANVVLLWAAQMARGYSKRTWLTYRQALQLGGQVRKGEKACPVVYYGQAKPKDAAAGATGDDGEPARAYRFLKLFHVFNVDQIDDLPTEFGMEMAPAPQAPSAIDAWIARVGARVVIGGSMACYVPVTDTIHMPARAAFRSDEHECVTRLHELTHYAAIPIMPRGPPKGSAGIEFLGIALGIIRPSRARGHRLVAP